MVNKKLEREEDRCEPFGASAPKRLVKEFDLKAANLENKTRSEKLAELMEEYVKRENKEENGAKKK